MKKLKTSEDANIDEKAYTSLLKDIKTLNSNTRTGAEKIVRVSSEVVRVIDKEEILRRLGDSTLVKKNKDQKLSKPLEKPQAKRLKRAIGYEEVVVDANKWGGIVKQRRRADQLKFPVEEVDVRVITTERNFIPPMKSDLEKEIYPLLYGAQLIEEKKETDEEVAVKRAMSLKEVKEKSREQWQKKLLRQRLEKKAALLNKSKSRKFHKILRREKLKHKKEEFEVLKEKDPEKALEILNEMEKSRIQERMDLRHRKSKWLHLQKDKAVRDKNVMEILQENKELGQEILQKFKDTLSDDEIEEISDHNSQKVTEQNKAHELMDEEEEISDFMQFKSQVEQLHMDATSNHKNATPEDKDEIVQNIFAMPTSSFGKPVGSSRIQSNFYKGWSNIADSDDEDEVVEGFENMYSDEAIIAEFQLEKQKQEEEKAKKDEDDGRIKGWGSWVGPGIIPNEKKFNRKRRIFRTAPDSKPANKYSNKPHVIYNESGDMSSNVRKHMVNELPFPFARVKDFEASIRQPIGRKFVPEIAHNMLIAPPIVKKMGTFINPISEDALLKNYEKQQKKTSKLERKFNEKLHEMKFDEKFHSKQPRIRKRGKKRSLNKNSSLKTFVIHK